MPHALLLSDSLDEYLRFCSQALLALFLNNALLEVSYIRHRWRMIILVGRLSAIGAITLLLSWPQEILFLPIAVCLNNCYVDPRLHLTSVTRGPSPLAHKLVDLVGAVCRHTGSTQVGATVMWTMIRHVTARDDTNLTFHLLPVPLLAICALQAISWGLESLVLLRVCPQGRAFRVLPAVIHTLMALCFICIVSDTSMSRLSVWATVFGHVVLLVRKGIMNAPVSTNELLSSTADIGSSKSHWSPARLNHHNLIHSQVPDAQPSELAGGYPSAPSSPRREAPVAATADSSSEVGRVSEVSVELGSDCTKFREHQFASPRHDKTLERWFSPKVNYSARDIEAG